LSVALCLGIALAAAPAGSAAGTRIIGAPGGVLSRSNPTPFPSSQYVINAQWATPRFDPPANQWGDILPTVWSSDGGTYVMMDDGGVDVPLRGGLWRQSLARISGSPPNLTFRHIGPSAPAPHNWAQIANNPDTDEGPLGPYYSIGFVEADGVFYATQQRNWNWSANGPFAGLAGIAYSTDHGNTWQSPGKPFGAPLGNLTFIDGGAPGGGHADGYLYAIGSEREFNASRLLLGRVRPGIQNITDPARWQWFAGTRTENDGRRAPKWASDLAAAAPVLGWDSHVTYPQMTYDRSLHRYLLTFTYSYSSSPPGVWKGGAELVILEAPSPAGPFSFVARSSEFGPSNGYDAGFPSQWISRDGLDLWLKWAANFTGCSAGLDCSGKYGFNVARVHLTTPTSAKAARAKARAAKPSHVRVVGVVSGASLLLLLALMTVRRRQLTARPPRRRHADGD
jgi:hypothetical protein